MDAWVDVGRGGGGGQDSYSNGQRYFLLVKSRRQLPVECYSQRFNAANSPEEQHQMKMSSHEPNAALTGAVDP